MKKVYDYDAADGSWSDAIGAARTGYDAAGIPVQAAPDGLYAERRLPAGTGFCFFCREFRVLGPHGECDDCR